MVNSRVNHLVKLVQRALNLSSSPFAVLHYVAISNCRLISQSHFIPFFLGLPLGRTFCFNIVCLAVGKASSLRSECCYADGSWCNWSLQVGTIAISIKIQNGLTFWAFWHWLTGLSRNIPPPLLFHDFSSQRGKPSFDITTTNLTIFLNRRNDDHCAYYNNNNTE